ncbi:40355_t:CDS:2, partial [Gigaspora margarita]
AEVGLSVGSPDRMFYRPVDVVTGYQLIFVNLSDCNDSSVQ